MLAAGVLCGARAVPVRGQESVIDRVRARYEASSGIEARFEQVTTLFDESDRLTGRIWLQGEKYRLETGSRTVVADGETVWVFDRAENQVIVSDFVEDETTFSITGFLYRFDERWRVTGEAASTQGAERVRIATVVPIDPDDWFSRVIVTVRERDAMVTRLEVVDASDVTMIFDLRNVVERPLEPGLFRFSPEVGVEIVDLRS